MRDRHQLRVRLAVHVDELREDELDPRARRARRGAGPRREASRWPWASDIAAAPGSRAMGSVSRSAPNRVCDVHIGARDEATTLRAVINAVFSTLEIDAVLAGVVDIATEATGCHACLIYLLEDDRLVLRAASPVHRPFVGRIEMGLDEGVTGWVARTKEAALIRDEALHDPRMKYFPELEEERWQSMAAVPITARSGELIGVIVLHTAAPREFSLEDVEPAHAHGHARRRRDRGRAALRGGARAGRGAHPARRGLPAARGGDAPRAHPRGGDGGRARRAARRPLPAVPARGRRPRPAARRLRPARRAPGRGRRAARCCSSCSPAAATAATNRDLWPDHEGAALLTAPLVASDEQLGLLVVLGPRRFGPGDEELLRALADQTAMGLERAELVARLTARDRVKDLFDALADGAVRRGRRRRGAGRLRPRAPARVRPRRARRDRQRRRRGLGGRVHAARRAPAGPRPVRLLRRVARRPERGRADAGRRGPPIAWSPCATPSPPPSTSRSA